MPVSGVYQIHPPGPLHLFFHGLDNNEAVITKLENYIGEGRMRALHEINLVLGVDISLIMYIYQDRWKYYAFFKESYTGYKEQFKSFELENVSQKQK